MEKLLLLKLLMTQSIRTSLKSLTCTIRGRICRGDTQFIKEQKFLTNR